MTGQTIRNLVQFRNKLAGPARFLTALSSRPLTSTRRPLPPRVHNDRARSMQHPLATLELPPIFCARSARGAPSVVATNN